MGDFNPSQAFGGSSKNGPQPPDFMGIARQQTHENRPDQTTPWATSSWTHTPTQGGGGGGGGGGAGGPGEDWSQHIGLSGPLDQANQSMMGQARDAWGKPLDNGQQARQHAEDAIYGRETSRLDPRFANEQTALEARLNAGGNMAGTPAWEKAMDEFKRGKNDAYQQAQYGSIVGGGQEASRQQQMDMTSRFAPMAGMSGIQGLTGMPGFSQSQLLPAAMAQYQGALQKYGIDQQGKNSMMNGASSAAAMAAMASDERLKYDVTRLDEEILPGVPAATFRYRDDPFHRKYRGVIAQDVESAGYRHLVSEHGGFKYVASSLAPQEVEDA